MVHYHRVGSSPRSLLSVLWSQYFHACLLLIFGVWVLLMLVERLMLDQVDVPRIVKNHSHSQSTFDHFVRIAADQVPFYNIIVYWTPYFSQDLISQDASYKAAKNRYGQVLKRPVLCYQQYPNCLVTSDRVFTNRSKALIFHWRDLSLADLPNRNAHRPKLWVLYNLESPVHTPKLPESSSPPYYFDLMASYRRDADLYLPYGRRVLKHTHDRGQKVSDVSNWKTKTIAIAWMVSHCKTHSHREDYAQQLAENVQVDIYGTCGSLKCDNTTRCYEDMARRYFFYLSFENSICQDYATEKVFNILSYSLVPIVYGGAAYKAILPPGSYIDARLYKPAELAKLVQSIMHNRARYESFFTWKRFYAIELGDHNEKLFCALCARLEGNKTKAAQLRYTVTLVNEWYFAPQSCANDP